MSDRRIESWDEFLSAVNTLYEPPPRGDAPAAYVSDLLFRGQSDASWKLETTLERWAGEGETLMRYLNDVSVVRSEIESRTGLKWDIPDHDEYHAALTKQKYGYPRPSQLYEYLVYLRHHGFPSPLLDWTASPFIAAYFAFRSAQPDCDVAIFGYREYVGGGKGGQAGGSEVHGLGPYVRSHPRHYLQQSQYTVCVEGSGAKRQYISHERVLSEQNTNQDLLWKFTLPGSLRRTALSYLHRHNITAYSLLGSEESLMESLAVRRYVLKTRPGGRAL